MDLSQRLDEMELAIHKPSFRKGTGRANEVNYWVFDYPPEKELEVRERVEYLKNKNDRGDDDFELVVFDLYDIILFPIWLWFRHTYQCCVQDRQYRLAISILQLISLRMP